MNEPSRERAEKFLAALQQQYSHALTLKERGQFDAAVVQFERCFDVAVQHEMPFTLPQYVDVMLMIGFCHTDLGRWKQALTVYHALEAVLKQEGEWYKRLPRGMKLAVQPDYDFDYALATLGDSIALAYDNDGQPERARPYYRSSIATYLKRDMKARAAKSFTFFGNGCVRYNRWDDLAMAGEKLHNLAVALGDLDAQIQGLHFSIQAAANRNQVDVMVPLLERVIEIERRVGHPALATDEKILNSVRQMTGGAGRSGLPDEALKTVVRFAAETCGCQVARLNDGSFVGVREGKREPCWRALIDEITEATAAGFGESQPGVELHLPQQPEAMVRVFESAPGKLTLRVHVEWKVPNVNQTGMAAVHTETINADQNALARVLRGLVKDGRLAVKDGRLICTMKLPKG